MIGLLAFFLILGWAAWGLVALLALERPAEFLYLMERFKINNSNARVVAYIALAIGMAISITWWVDSTNTIDWGKIANIAAVLQTGLLVVSIFFIWYELRRNNQLTQAANVDRLVELSSPFNMQLYQDPYIAELWVHGKAKYHSMDEVERSRYRTFITWWLILHENIYYQWRQGLIDYGAYKPWEHDLKSFVQNRIPQPISDIVGKNFQKEFREHVYQTLNDQE